MNNEDRISLVKYRLVKAEETLKEVNILIKNELWNTAVNRIYYANYYAVTAFLVSQNIRAVTHAGVRQMLSLHFVKTNIIDRDHGKFYSYIFDMRHTADYSDYIDYDQNQVMPLIEPSKKLINKISEILSQNQSNT
ncbi:MAG: HEPN domain-containing protein [Bacteroidota bacterium]